MPLTPDTGQALADAFDTRLNDSRIADVQRDSLLYKTGQPIERIYYVNKGRVGVFGANEQTPILVVFPGSLLGVTEVFNHKTHTFTTVAETDARVASTSVDTFFNEFSNNPAFALAVAAQLAESLRIQYHARKVQSFRPKDLELADLLTQGKSNGEISSKLGISDKTTKNYISRLLYITGSYNRIQAVLKLIDSEIIDVNDYTTAQNAKKVVALTPREKVLLAYLAQTNTTPIGDLGKKTGITGGTVRNDLLRICDKLGVASRTGAVVLYRRALKDGII